MGGPVQISIKALSNKYCTASVIKSDSTLADLLHATLLPILLLNAV